MASTTLFAPQVRSVQPAFEYNGSSGEVKIYFSLSAYNKLDEVKAVSFTIADPNIGSGFGAYSIIKQGAVNKDQFVFNNNEYYIIINFTGNDVILTKNQYYQVQLTFIAQDDTKSLPSQVTLIRPIPPVQEVVIEQNNQTLLSFNKISGFIKYEGESTVESIKDFYFIIGEYTSKIYSNTI